MSAVQALVSGGCPCGQPLHYSRPEVPCPHKGFPLGSLPPDEKGRRTCPAHGLRWGKDGRLAPHTEAELAEAEHFARLTGEEVIP